MTEQSLNCDRRYTHTFADLVDRLSICILKSIFIPSNKKAYDAEIQEPTEDREVMVIDEKYEICNLDRSELNQKIQIREKMLLLMQNR